tara:strand:- start:906 stop:2033 length:1128 start_codon:yes stop_codon:yes gene_type:complete
MGKGTTVVYESPPPDTTFQKYLDYQSKKDEDANYQNWLKDVNQYTADLNKQSSGRKGFADFYNNLQSRLDNNQITIDAAKDELTDYASKYHFDEGTLTARKPGEDPRKNWERFQIEDDPDTKDIDETGVKLPSGGWVTVPTKDTTLALPTIGGQQWDTWDINKAINTLGQHYDTNIKPGKQKYMIDNALEDLLGITETVDNPDTPDIDESKPYTDAFAKWNEKFTKGPVGYGKDDLRADIKDTSAYKSKHAQTYLQSYYGEMYNAERNSEGALTGNYTVDYGKLNRFAPKMSTELMDKLSFDSVPDFSTPFTGTIGEIDISLADRKLYYDTLYTAGLTNLQGTIDADLQKLKNASNEKIAGIQMQANLVSGFWNS